MPSPRPGAQYGSFRQIRWTVTHELPTRPDREGLFSLTVYAKPLNAAWSEPQCILRTRTWAPRFPLETLVDVLDAVIEICELEKISLAAQTPED